MNKGWDILDVEGGKRTKRRRNRKKKKTRRKRMTKKRRRKKNGITRKDKCSPKKNGEKLDFTCYTKKCIK